MQNYQQPFPINPNFLIAGRYILGRPLGQGTFGQVFEAEDIKFAPPKKVALKLLHPQFINNPQVREDLRREAGVLARFNHPNILRVVDFEVTQGLAYIVTDLAEGGSLLNKIMAADNQTPTQMPLEQVARYLEQIAGALDEAHRQGLIHRDIKPANILLDKWDRPLLADFGLAAALGGTQASIIMEYSTSGTPHYMSPEQWHGQTGKASDIYSLGVLVYQLITGYTPYQGNQFELMGQHINAQIPPLSLRTPNLKYPPSLDRVIAEAMAKDQHQRIRPASAFADHFKQAIEEAKLAQPVEKQFVQQVQIPVQTVVQPLENHENQSAPATEIVKPNNLAPAYAETQVVALPSRPIENAGQVLPNPPPVVPQVPFNNNQNYFSPTPNPQPPYQYNNNFGPVQPSYNPVRPVKNKNALYIGLGVGAFLLFVLIIVLVTNKPSPNNNTPATNNGNNNNSGHLATFLYPGAIKLNVSDVVKADCVNEVTSALQASSTGVNCNYYSTRDSSSRVLQFYTTTAQNRGLIVHPFTIGANPDCLQITNTVEGFAVVILPQSSANMLFGPNANGLTIFALVD